MKKLLLTPEGIIETEMTSEEIENQNQDYIIWQQNKVAREEKIEQEKARKESAIAKLKALGLTEEEVKSIL
jgi:DNA-binding transcriptional regulator YhcF (GntR family)